MERSRDRCESAPTRSRLRVRIDRMRGRDVLERIDAHMADIRAEFELNRRQHELNQREHMLNCAAMHEMRDAMRAIAAEARANTEVLYQMRDELREQTEEIRGQTRAIFRLLDERDDGGEPGAAPG